MLIRIRKIVPYVIVLAITGYLYFVASQIAFAAPGGRIGPDRWPKAVLLLAMATCAYEIIKTLFFGKVDEGVGGVLESIVEEAPSESPIPNTEYPTPLLTS